MPFIKPLAGAPLLNIDWNADDIVVLRDGDDPPGFGTGSSGIVGGNTNNGELRFRLEQLPVRASSLTLWVQLSDYSTTAESPPFGVDEFTFKLVVNNNVVASIDVRPLIFEGDNIVNTWLSATIAGDFRTTDDIQCYFRIKDTRFIIDTCYIGETRVEYVANNTPNADIKTIKPAGGGDYTNLATWWANVRTAANANQWAECYEGNVGGVNISVMDQVAPNAIDHPRIYSVRQHQGVEDRTNKSSVVNATISIGIAYVDIDGLEFYKSTAGLKSITNANQLAYAQIRVRDCLFVDAAATPTVNQVDLTGTTFQQNGVQFINNIFYSASGIKPFITWGTPGTVVSSYVFWNNTFVGAPAFQLKDNNAFVGFSNNIVAASVPAVLGAFEFLSHPTDYIRNNLYTAAVGVRGDTSDTNSLYSQTLGSIFNNSGSDWNLKAGSPAIDMGSILSEFGFNDDYRGTTRMGTWDIGAHEYVAGTEVVRSIIDGLTIIDFVTGINVPLPTDIYGQAVIEDSPIAYYRESDSTNQMLDSSGYGNHGTHNSVTLQQSSLLYNNPNLSALYAAVSQSAVPNIVNGPVFTFEFWAVWNSGIDGKVFSFNNAYSAFEFENQSSGRARFTYGGKYIDSLLPLVKNKIYYVVCVIENDTAKLYINNVLQGTSSGSYKLYRLREIGPLFKADGTQYNSEGSINIINYEWMAANSLDEAMNAGAAGSVLVHNVDSGDTTYLFSGPAFRVNEIEAKIWLEDQYGYSYSDNDYNDAWFDIVFDKVASTPGANKLGVNYLGRLDEFAIYNRVLPEARIDLHWQIGKHPDPSEGYGLVDTISISDTLSYSIIKGISIIDTIVIDDFSGKAKALTDSLAFNDLVNRQIIGTHGAVDTVPSIDAVDVEYRATGVFWWQKTDLLRIQDFVEASASKILIDVVNITDFVDTPGLKYENVTTTIQIVDSLVLQVPGKIFRFLTDKLTFIDSVIVDNPKKNVKHKDVLFVVDTLVMQGPISKALADQLTFIERIHLSLNKIKLTDTFGISDIAHINLHVESLLDRITIQEFLRVSPIKLAVTTQLTFTEIVNVFSNHFYFTDTVNILDHVEYHSSNIKIEVLDTLTILDRADWEPAIWSPSFIDTLEITDELKRDVPFDVVDTLTIEDSVLRVWPFEIEDELEFDDLVEFTKSRAFLDQLTILDSVCYCASLSYGVTDVVQITDRATWRLGRRIIGPTIPTNNGFHLRLKLHLRIKDQLYIQDRVKLPTIIGGCCMSFADRLDLLQEIGVQKNLDPLEISNGEE